MSYLIKAGCKTAERNKTLNAKKSEKYKTDNNYY
jgi:hypothetical protein